jgi:DNA-directed RNA polymerase subunit RPC12/RpoP
MITTGSSLAGMIRRFRTRLHVGCSRCGRETWVEVFLEEVPRLRCRVCGAHNPMIMARDQTKRWARKRQGK